MTNSIRILSMQALLAAALAAQPSLAGQFDGPTGTEADRMTAVLGRLDELTKSLNSLVNELKNLPAKLSETNKSLQVAAAQEEINSLKLQVGQLQKEIADLRNRASAATSQSLYPPASTGTGRLRLINSYVVPVSILVNDVSYQLAPGETRFVEGLRAGPFTYEVLAAGYGSIQPRVGRTLAANDTYTIRVEPIR